MGQLIFGILWLTWFFVNLAGFLDGMDIWLGAGWFLALLAALALTYFGLFGSLAYAMIAYHGMTSGWGWDWFSAGVIAFPLLAVFFFGGAAIGMGSIFTGIREASRR